MDTYLCTEEDCDCVVAQLEEVPALARTRLQVLSSSSSQANQAFSVENNGENPVKLHDMTLISTPLESGKRLKNLALEFPG